LAYPPVVLRLNLQVEIKIFQKNEYLFEKPPNSCTLCETLYYKSFILSIFFSKKTQKNIQLKNGACQKRENGV